MEVMKEWGVLAAMAVSGAYGVAQSYGEWEDGSGLSWLWGVFVVCCVGVVVDQWNVRKEILKRRVAVQVEQRAGLRRKGALLEMPPPPSPPSPPPHASRSVSPPPREIPSFVPSPTPPPTATPQGVTPPPTPPPRTAVRWDWTLYYTTELPTTRGLKRKRSPTPLSDECSTEIEKSPLRRRVEAREVEL